MMYKRDVRFLKIGTLRKLGGIFLVTEERMHLRQRIKVKDCCNMLVNYFSFVDSLIFLNDILLVRTGSAVVEIKSACYAEETMLIRSQNFYLCKNVRFLKKNGSDHSRLLH